MRKTGHISLANICCAWLIINCSGASTSRVDLPTLANYVEDPDHGLKKVHSVMGITTTVKLIPPELTALRELPDAEKDSCYAGWNALLDRNDDMICFLLNLKTDGVKRKGDVMYAGALTPEAFKEQAYELNFNWEQQLELRCGEDRYRPVLSSLENTYGLSSDRNVMVVFVPEKRADRSFYGSDIIELRWNDAVFGTGLQRFLFDRSALKSVPAPTVRS